MVICMLMLPAGQLHSSITPFQLPQLEVPLEAIFLLLRAQLSLMGAGKDSKLNTLHPLLHGAQDAVLHDERALQHIPLTPVRQCFA
ncbi:hypothetical protein ABBQ32_001458 [Trebouxia sp. C0010 RCD-2024]